MLRPNKFLMWSFVSLALSSQGCASVGLKNGIPYFSRQEQWEPDVTEDKWSYVGKAARGNRKLENENDPLKSVLMSKEAQNIERNLGYE